MIYTAGAMMLPLQASLEILFEASPRNRRLNGIVLAYARGIGQITEESTEATGGSQKRGGAGGRFMPPS
ncbi:MAG: hypothetical protein ACRD2G_20035 [Terriglobia bacterium]